MVKVYLGFYVLGGNTLKEIVLSESINVPRVLYCPNCESIFIAKRSGLKRFGSAEHKCPYCNVNRIMKVDAALSVLKKDIYKCLRRVDKIREFIDKMILKIDNIVSSIIKVRELRVVMKENNVFSDILTLYAELGVIIDELEERIERFQNDFAERVNIISEEIRGTHQTLRLSYLSQITDGLNTELNTVLNRIQAITEKYSSIKKEVEEQLVTIEVIRKVGMSADTDILNIIKLDHRNLLVITAHKINIINLVKKKIVKTISLDQIMNVVLKRGIFSFGVLIERLDGKKTFIKVSPEIAASVINAITKARALSNYYSNELNLEVEQRAVKPTTKRLREKMLRAKLMVVKSVDGLKRVLFDEFARGNSRNGVINLKDLAQNEDTISKKVIRLLLKDIEKKYELGLIGFEEYMKVKKYLLTRLFESGEEADLGSFRDDPLKNA